MDVGDAVKNAKAGQVRYRTDKNGIVHGGIGKVGFEPTAIKENLEALIARPVFYELAELAEEVEDGQEIELRIWSNGTVFSLGMAGTGE